MQLDAKDWELLNLAVNALANWRETDNINLSRNDVIAQKNNELLRKLKPVGPAQQKDIDRLRELGAAFLDRQMHNFVTNLIDP